MATGPQLMIRPDELARELALSYLVPQGVGVFGKSFFLDRMPDTPIANTVLIMDPAPTPASDPVSHPHFTMYLRDTDVATCGARAALVWEKLHRQRLALPSYWLWVTADHTPSNHRYNANNEPVHTLGFSTFGIVRRA